MPLCSVGRSYPPSLVVRTEEHPAELERISASRQDNWLTSQRLYTLTQTLAVPTKPSTNMTQSTSPKYVLNLHLLANTPSYHQLYHDTQKTLRKMANCSLQNTAVNIHMKLRHHIDASPEDMAVLKKNMSDWWEDKGNVSLSMSPSHLETWADLDFSPSSTQKISKGESSTNDSKDVTKNHTANILVDIANITLDCGVLELAFYDLNILPSADHITGISLSPSALLQYSANSLLPYSQPFLHMHVGLGPYLISQKFWTIFVNWYLDKRRSLIPLQQALETVYISSGLRNVESISSINVWKQYFSYPLEIYHYHEASWQIWLTAFSLEHNLYTYHLPGCISVVNVPDTLLQLFTSAKPKHVVSFAETGVHLFPQSIIYMDLMNTAHAACDEALCFGHQKCLENMHSMFSNSVNCLPALSTPSLVINVIALCSRPHNELLRTLKHLLAAEIASPSLIKANSDASEMGQHIHDQEQPRLFRNEKKGDSRMGIDNEHSSKWVNNSQEPRISRRTMLRILLVSEINEPTEIGTNHLKLCERHLETATRFYWPFGSKVITHIKPPLPPSLTSIKTFQYLQNISSENMMLPLLSKLWPRDVGCVGYCHVGCDVLFVEAGIETSLVYRAWVDILQTRYSNYRALAGVALYAFPTNWKTQRRKHSTIPNHSDTGVLAAPSIGRGAVLIHSRFRNAFLAWARITNPHRILDSQQLLLQHTNPWTSTLFSPWQVLASYLKVFSNDNALFFLHPPLSVSMCQYFINKHDGINSSISNIEGDNQPPILPLVSRNHWEKFTFPEPQYLPAISMDGHEIWLCFQGKCPQGTECHDSMEGSVCLCTSKDECEEGSQISFHGSQRNSISVSHPVKQDDSVFAEDKNQEIQNAPSFDALKAEKSSHVNENTAIHSNNRSIQRIFTDQETLSRLLSTRAKDGTVVVVTTNSGFLDFFYNWRSHAHRLGVTHYIVIAEDIESYRHIKRIDHEHVILSHASDTSSSNRAKLTQRNETGFSYGTANYNYLVGRRPIYLSQILQLGYSVLYADTDTVWLENPFKYFPTGYDVYIQSDKEGITCAVWC